MGKKFISLLLTITILIGCFSIGFSGIIIQAREAGVGTGAESFNPVIFSCAKEVLIGTDVDTTLNVEVTDKNYKIKINSISASMIYYDESGPSVNFNIDYAPGVVVSGTNIFDVTCTIPQDVNSVVRYTIEYDILGKTNNTVWKNLTGYTYCFVSGSEAKTGPVGTYHAVPGILSDGCYFEVLETLNTTYVQQQELSLLYKIRTQSAWHYHDPRTRGVNIISGNAPSTLKTMPDNGSDKRQGQMDWPKCNATYRSASADWLRMSEPTSGYYNFTISFNSWNDDWEDQSNITETTEMYYIRNGDKVAAYNVANKFMKTANTFSDGFYMQKGVYTEASWNNFISAIDMAYQVALSVPNANYGYKIACQNAVSVESAVQSAFAALEKAEHDFIKYKDVVRVEPTCTETGSETYVCVCGEVKVDTIPANGHDQGEWMTGKIPTCTSVGENELICTTCGDVIKTWELPMIAHVYKDKVIAPTCTEKGYTEHTCINCGSVYTSDFVDATGHSWDRIVTEPTCTEKGFTTYKCKVCGFSLDSMFVNATGHKPAEAVQENIVEATCVSSGSYESVVYCKTCSEELSRETIQVDALGHTETVVVENEVAATPTTDGSYDTVVYCSVCGEELSRETIVVPALGHEAAEAVEENRVEATCTTEGSYDVVVYCSCCEEKAELSRETITVDALGHTEGEAVVENEVAADCVNAGSYDTVVYCTVCNEEVSRETTTIDALGHTDGEWVVTKEAEVGVAGEETLYCAVCGEAFDTKEIPAISAYFRAAEGTTTVVDKENGFIYGLEEYLYDLEGFVEYEGGEVEYIESENGFGTGTVVNFIVNGEVYESYTIIIFGDLTGDGVIDTYDTAKLAAIANFDIEVEEGSAIAIAADVAENDGVADTYDLARLYQVVNGDTTISQIQEIA